MNSIISVARKAGKTSIMDSLNDAIKLASHFNYDLYVAESHNMMTYSLAVKKKNVNYIQKLEVNYFDLYEYEKIEMIVKQMMNLSDKYLASDQYVVDCFKAGEEHDQIRLKMILDKNPELVV